MAKVVGYEESAKTRITCKGRNISDPGCGAIVEYVKDDIKTYSGTDYGGGADGQTWVDCPNCRRRLVLTSW